VSREAGVKLPAGTEGDVRWSDATEQSEAYVDCQNRPDLNVDLKTVQEFNDLDQDGRGALSISELSQR
jgi:hypothetical protein